MLGWHMASQPKILTITHFSVYFQRYTHTQPFATKHFLYDVRTVEQNISLCFPTWIFLFLAVAWKRPPAQGKGQKNWHSIIVAYISSFSSVSRALGRYPRSLLFSYPPTDFFLRARLYIPGEAGGLKALNYLYNI